MIQSSFYHSQTQHWRDEKQRAEASCRLYNLAPAPMCTWPPRLRWPLDCERSGAIKHLLALIVLGFSRRQGRGGFGSALETFSRAENIRSRVNPPVSCSHRTTYCVTHTHTQKNPDVLPAGVFHRVQSCVSITVFHETKAIFLKLRFAGVSIEWWEA